MGVPYEYAKIEEGEGLRKGLELVELVSDKHLDLLRPSARYYSMFKGQTIDAADREKGKYTLIRDPEDFQQGLYDKPLPCFGCGIGWFSFLSGFACPLMWYYATVLYFGNYYRKDPRERGGLAASAIAVSTFPPPPQNPPHKESHLCNGMYCRVAYHRSYSDILALLNPLPCSHYGVHLP
ncbi:hypothetical protein RJ639_019666 [Escallonia herrerae]|uniref:Uncharacterized protein n=1 Tax=Escallonia herrerae TaxID=1293975 RepID=A0AA88VAD1_9ASTE|nr:hypothetical protein RJ639_019666 [Escallonia herrerae]